MLKKIIICIFFIVIIIALLFVPLFPRLVLNGVKNNKVNFIFSINKKEFLISYKGRVRDYYIINTNNDIVLEKTRFVSYGAGMPDPQNDEKIIITDDYIEINNINKIIKDLYLFIGTVASHKIEFDVFDGFNIDRKEIELNRVFKPQVNIKIQYKRVSLFAVIMNFINNKVLRENNEA
ncbi:DUF1850 domain-containing protein [uncultured Brachyspira sp.]|uniref:DUF1850 domain-containing protein n=1 Tax=uncultured Brachyspira sp. TaxID=221953 RepID=UPI00260B5C42|nr:DUF1850 domain-containing protein [uncultured Brachyspira sp.]